MRTASIRNSATVIQRVALFGLVLVASVVTSGIAQAQDRNYLVEVVVFENMDEASRASAGAMYIPRTGGSIGLSSDTAASAGFRLLDEATALTDAADKIKASGSYRLLKHFAWQQPGLDDRNAKAIKINIGRAMPVFIPEDTQSYDKFVPASAQPEPSKARQINTTTVNGTLKLRLGRFLHLDSQLVFTDIENRKSYRISQSRKMRSGEFHYIDNPRFGFLVKILPLESTAN